MNVAEAYTNTASGDTRFPSFVLCADQTRTWYRGEVFCECMPFPDFVSVWGPFFLREPTSEKNVACRSRRFHRLLQPAHMSDF